MLSDFEFRLVAVEVLQKFNEGVQGLALVVFMGVDTAGDDNIAVKVQPGKFAIVIDGFANLECNVPAQMVYFTEDVHFMVYMGDKLTMDIHGRDTMEKQFSAFIGDIKASHHQNGQQVIAVEGDTATAGRLW